MNIEELRAYCLNKNKATEDFPFNKDTLVFKVFDKMFALIPLEKWESGEASINLKCNPEYAIELREQYNCISSGFHMNKKHWNTVSLNSSELLPQQVCQLIDHSYNMVVKGMPKKLQVKLLLYFFFTILAVLNSSPKHLLLA